MTAREKEFDLTEKISALVVEHVKSHEDNRGHQCDYARNILMNAIINTKEVLDKNLGMCGAERKP